MMLSDLADLLTVEAKSLLSVRGGSNGANTDIHADVVLSLYFKQWHAALLSGRARRNTTPMTGMVGRLG